VSRGFLGLTVACARCHDHKYDPIPQRDYYSLAGVFLNSPYHEYPLAPASVVDEYKALEKKKKNKQELLSDFMNTESRQLAETLALQTSTYMQAAWKVTGEPKGDAAETATKEKLDYELFQRWLRFLAKPPKFYPYLKKWQEMVKEGGSEDEAKTLATEFQEQVVEVMFEARAIKEENDIIRAKALPGTKKKEKANLPNEFVTNDDFCPGCGLELKSLPGDKVFLYGDMFREDLVDSADPANAKEEDKPGLFVFRGPSLDRWLGADRRRYIEELREDIKALTKALPAKYAYVHGVQDVEKPSPINVAIRGNPFKPGDEVSRHFPSILVDGDPAPFAAGSGRQELADAIARQPLAMRVIVNRVWKWHFGTGLVNSPSNFGKIGDPPSNPELLEHLASWFVENGQSIKKLQRQMMLSAVYQSSADDSPAAFAKDSGNRWYWRANRRRMTAEEVRDSALFAAGALDDKMGGPSEELTPSATRRTLYGRISRYKLDSSPRSCSISRPQSSASSASRRTCRCSVLFLMNSDFMQQQAELVAARSRRGRRHRRGSRSVSDPVRACADGGRARVGLAYFDAEPMKEYEERKAAAARRRPSRGRSKMSAKAPAPDGGRTLPTRRRRAAATSPGDMMSGVSASRREKSAKPGPSACGGAMRRCCSARASSCSFVSGALAQPCRDSHMAAASNGNALAFAAK
jgi:hypothetical protein